MATEIAQAPRSAAADLAMLLNEVGTGALDDLGWIRVTGTDRMRWLNGMVTNSIQDLEPGDGNYSFVLNAQGRIQADLSAFVGDEKDLLIQTGRNRVAGLIELFGRFIIMDEVELEDVSRRRAGFAVAGPGAGIWLEKLGLNAGERLRTVVPWRGGRVEVISGHSPLVPRFELWTDLDTAKKLLEALDSQVVGAQAFEWLRVLEGTPTFGADIRDKDLPQETMQARALHFAKGCYLGQEIVERIRSRGQVHRQFGGFMLEGSLPAVGAVLEANGKPVGELTSVAAIPVGGTTLHLGLGYARREAVGPGSRLAYAGYPEPGWATSVTLPIKPDAIATKDLGITLQ